jgi:hypothetical protein
VLDVKLTVPPVQTGLLDETVGATGAGFMVTTVVLATLLHPLTVIIKEYVPAAAEVALGIVGFCKVDVNPFGPDQLYVALDTVLAVRLSVLPAQIGLFDDAVAAAGA